MATTAFSTGSGKIMTGTDGSDFALFLHSEDTTGWFDASQGNYRRDLFTYLGSGKLRVKKSVRLKFTATMYSITGSGGLCYLRVYKNDNLLDTKYNREYLNSSITADFSAGDTVVVSLYQEYKPCAAVAWCVVV